MEFRRDTCQMWKSHLKRLDYDDNNTSTAVGLSVLKHVGQKLDLIGYT